MFFGLIGKSLLTSWSTFCFISTRIYIEKKPRKTRIDCKRCKSLFNSVTYTIFSVFHVMSEEVSAVKNCKFVGWQKR